MGRLRLSLTSNSTSETSKMAAAAILKIHFNSHNSVASASSYTQFGSDTKTDVIHCVQKKTPIHVFFYISVENV